MNERKTEMKKKKKIKVTKERLVIIAGIVLVLLVAVFSFLRHEKRIFSKRGNVPEMYIENPPEFDVQLLDINDYSRPGIALDEVCGIVVHYTANPGTTAQQNRDYFQGLSQSKVTKASSHFIIGLGGEIIQCVPCNEVAYASNGRNYDTVSIECCIPDETGKFNDATYDSLVHLVTWLMGRYYLTTEEVIRHYDVTGKNCPKYFVEHPLEWQQFLEDLNNYIRWNGVKRTTQ